MVNLDIFSSGDPRTGSATLNGRQVSLEVLAGLGDEALIGAIQQGQLQIGRAQLDQLVEIRNMQGKSGLFNFLNGVGQDVGVVGETGVGAIERGGRLATFVASLYGAGKIFGAAKALPSLGILNQARNVNSISGALGVAKDAASVRNIAIAAGGAAATGAAISGLTGGDDSLVTPADVTPPDPATEAVFDASTTAAETGQETEVEIPPGGDPNNPFSMGGAGGAIKITPILDETGVDTGLIQLTFPNGDVEYIGRDELPVNNPDLRARQRMLEDFNLAERKFNQTITALNTINSIRQSTDANNRANAQFQIDLANTLADPRSATILRAGIARQPQGTSVNPLLAAFTNTRPGDLTLSDTGLSEQVASLFGLRAGQDIPVPGAERQTTVSTVGEGEQASLQRRAPGTKSIAVNEGGGNTSTVNLGTPGTSLPATTKVSQKGQEFDLTGVPLNNVLNSLTTEERGLFDALIQISGNDPAELERKRQTLASPGSGRSVFAAFG